MKQYQDMRNEVVDTYEHRMDEIERTIGSLFYEEEKAKAIDTKNTSLDNLRKQFFPAFQEIFKAMDNANANRKMDAPTQEQLNLISALRLKKNVTDVDFTAAAHSLASNGLALGLLQELAQERGSVRNFLKFGTTNELSVPAGEQTIRNMWDSVVDFTNYSTTRASRLNQAFNKRHGYETTELKKRPLFNSKAEMFAQISDLTDEGVEAFCKAVDGDE